jgi:PPOX class probable F420-dependent enzyme, Rv3369 family
MAVVLPDPTTEFGARVARRLREEMLVWLTVVDGAGTPQPAPVWFLWDGESVLVYSHGEAKRLDHVRANPRVALHFDGNGHGGDIVVLTGRAEITAEPLAEGNPDYLAKYGAWITDGWQTAESFGSVYSVPVRIHPRRVRGH